MRVGVYNKLQSVLPDYKAVGAETLSSCQCRQHRCFACLTTKSNCGDAAELVSVVRKSGRRGGSWLQARKKNTKQATQFSHLRDGIAIGPNVVMGAIEAV